MREAIIFIGIPASGKSIYYQNHFRDTHLRINLDMLGRRSREKAVFEAAVTTSTSIVIDNTNTTIEDRQRYIPFLKEHGYKIIAIYFDTALGIALHRNSLRERIVPFHAIKKFSDQLVEPSYGEGFNKIRVVKAEPVMKNVKE